MTKEMNPLDDQFHTLLETVERLRNERYSQLDPGVVREILRLHADSAAVENHLIREVERVVELHMAQEE